MIEGLAVLEVRDVFEGAFSAEGGIGVLPDSSQGSEFPPAFDAVSYYIPSTNP